MGLTYMRVGLRSSSPRVSAERPSTFWSILSFSCLKQMLRTSEYPFECMPLDRRPRMISPFWTFEPSMIRFFSTTPTAKPAMSNSSFEYRSGISAVSPPIRAQSACRQPAAMPSTICAIFAGSSLSTAR